MSKRLEMTNAFIKLLANSSTHQRKILLRGASNEQLKGLFELCLNIVRGNLPVSGVQFRRLKRERKTLETLANRRVPIYQKRNIINQKGGFLGQLATFAIPLLAHIVASKLKK